MLKKKWTNVFIDEMLDVRVATFIRNEDVTNISAPSVTKIEWKCLKCKHVWRATVDSINHMKSGCPSCSGNLKVSKESWQQRFDASQRKIRIMTLGSGRKNHERKGLFKCLTCSNEWSTTISNIVSGGQGCPKCCQSGRYQQSWFNKHPEQKSKPGLLYIVEFQSQEEHFLKVGITKHTISRRFPSYKYRYNIIPLISKKLMLYNAWIMEQKIKNEFREYSYLPLQQPFGGRTECFNISIKNNILENIK